MLGVDVGGRAVGEGLAVGLRVDIEVGVGVGGIGVGVAFKSSTIVIYEPWEPSTTCGLAKAAV